MKGVLAKEKKEGKRRRLLLPVKRGKITDEKVTSERRERSGHIKKKKEKLGNEGKKKKKQRTG